MTAVAESTGVTTIDNHNVLSYAVNLASPLSLAPGTYWLSIVETNPLTIDEAWEWASTASGSGAINVRRLPPSTANWIPVGSGPGAAGGRENRAFILDDTALSSHPEHPDHPEHPEHPPHGGGNHVPDAGSTLTLLAIALGALRFCRR